MKFPHPGAISLPTQKQLLLPLLEALEENGGILAPKDAQQVIADKLHIPQEILEKREFVSGAGEINVLGRRIRWTRQTAVARGLIEASTPRNLWKISEKGKNSLNFALPGIVITFYETPQGKAIWGKAESALGLIEENSLQLILTSPPYPLVRKKEYQGNAEREYLTWLTDLAQEWKPKLKHDGSLILNLSDCWNPKSPTLNLYQERLLLSLVDSLGYHLVQRLYWHSPSKIPSSHWVTVKKCRLNASVEHLFWLSPSEEPKSHPERLLKPYKSSMRRSIKRGGDFRKQRPSTHGGTQGGFSRDRGGSIPFTLQSWSHAASNNSYINFCKEAELPTHPARFPSELANFAIQLATDPNDLIYDPFAGSNTTGATAEALGRKWITSESCLQYIQGSVSRFLPEAVS